MQTPSGGAGERISREVPGATALADRSLAPDLARGAMLLLIALANSHFYLYGHEIGVRGYPADGSAVDRVVTLVQMTLVDGRAYPMFATLFGYGIVQILRRQAAFGRDAVAARKLIRRRGWWMVLFGFGHALLLFFGDIIGAYGLLAVVLAGVIIRAGDRTLLVTAAVLSIPTVLFGLFQGLPLPEDTTMFLPSMTTTDPLPAAAFRVGEWLVIGISQAFLALIPPLLIGAWAARRRLLDDPEQHRRFLARAAVLGIPLAALGALPMALQAAQLWQDYSILTGMVAGGLHAIAGYAGGVGFAALAGVITIRLRDRRGPVVTALAACGQRSMTCYLAQSVVFVAVLAAYGGGLGDQFSVATTAVLAVATWVATVLLAEFLRRGGYRGPFEVLLRRLTYGRPATLP
ncbi:MAG: DUF418 domain-containing protein [Actinobacteria bacterium]|nr:DUF418 domain-containing protein [Actinomycetota bacterium]